MKNNTQTEIKTKYFFFKSQNSVTNSEHITTARFSCCSNMFMWSQRSLCMKPHRAKCQSRLFFLPAQTLEEFWGRARHSERKDNGRKQFGDGVKTLTCPIQNHYFCHSPFPNLSLLTQTKLLWVIINEISTIPPQKSISGMQICVI